MLLRKGSVSVWGAVRNELVDLSPTSGSQVFISLKATPSPSPPAGACAKLFISSPYDATCLSTFRPDGVFLIFGWGPSGLALRHADGLSTLRVQPEARTSASLLVLPPAWPVLHKWDASCHGLSSYPYPLALDTFIQPHDQFSLARGIFSACQLDGTVLSCVRTMVHPPS